MTAADGLSEGTLAWPDWYNSLLEEEQSAISDIPSGPAGEDDIVKTEDTEASATEDELRGCPPAPADR